MGSLLNIPHRPKKLSLYASPAIGKRNPHGALSERIADATTSNEPLLSPNLSLFCLHCKVDSPHECNSILREGSYSASR